MNKTAFAARNVADKLGKVVGDLETLRFYWRTYVLSRLDKVDPTTYMVSYPKCGRTWLRVMLQNYLRLQGRELHFYNDRALVRAGDEIVKFEHGQGNWVPAPPTLSSLAFRRGKFAGKRVVFLVRDPRDVLVSSWYHLRYRENIYRGELAEFIREDLVGVAKVVAYLNMWVDNADVPGSFCLLTYEDLHADPRQTFVRTLEFMSIPVDDALVEQAVEESSFKRMKEMELSGALKEPWMKPGSKNLGKSMKVRKGKVGSYREELSDGDVRFLDGFIRTNLSPKLSIYVKG